MPIRSPQTIWETALGQLELQVTRPNFETWLRPTTALRLDGQHLVVGVPSDFALEWLRTRMAGIVSRTVSRLLNTETTVSFEVLGASTVPDRSEERADRSAVRPAHSLVGHLDAKLTFDAFVVLQCNRIAYRAGRRALSDEAYGSLVIAGPAGSGKTHLLHAIGNDARASGRSVVALTGEAFVNRYVSAVRTGQPHTFREAFGDCEFFLLDDLRFLASRQSSQEQFLLAIDTLCQRNCVLVVTADSSPEEIEGLSGRLITRLRSAVIAHLSLLSATERLEFLQALALSVHHEVPPAVLSYISQLPGTSAGDLVGRLRQITAYIDLSGQPISLSLAREALATSRSPNRIIDAVCSRFSVSREQLAGRSRARDVTYPRHLAMYLLRELGSCSLTQIGQLLGGRDHSTVLSGYNRIKLERASLPQTQAALNQLESLLQQHHVA